MIDSTIDKKWKRLGSVRKLKVMFSETHFHETTPKAGSRENCKLLWGLPAITARNSPVLGCRKSRSKNAKQLIT